MAFPDPRTVVFIFDQRVLIGVFKGVVLRRRNNNLSCTVSFYMTDVIQQTWKKNFSV